MLNGKFLFAVLFAIAASACNNGHRERTETTDSAMKMDIKEEAVSYQSDSVTCKGYVTYDAAKAGKRPVVLIAPEWWGLTNYPRMRAKQLAEMGYIAMAMDIYGNGKLADQSVADAGAASTPFYKDPNLANSRISAALAKIKTYPQADTTRIAAIGYCFGGGILLNYAKMGGNLNGVVSFHGGLAGVPAKKDMIKANILVCHGGADSFVPQTDVDAFKKSMDSVNANYTFKVYPGATHAFTNPNATEMGKKFNIPVEYNAAADSASWKDMQEFFGRIFK